MVTHFSSYLVLASEYPEPSGGNLVSAMEKRKDAKGKFEHES